MWRPVPAFLALLTLACGPATSGDDTPVGDGGPRIDSVPSVCSPGQKRCTGADHEVCQNNAWVVDQTCPNACSPDLGCVLCLPGTGTCDGNTSHACKFDGSGYEDIVCDSAIGLTCEPATGVCTGPCAPAMLGTSYIGCEYYPTVTGNEVDGNFNFAVAVSNTTAENVTVTVDGGALSAPMTFSVPPNSVTVQNLPWVALLKACMSNGQLECGATTQPAALVPKGAYRLRSSKPVTVYQFNPLEYQVGSQFSYTNDASLLIPANAMTGNYYAVTWPMWTSSVGPFPGFLAVTATRDGTQVQVAPTVAIQAGNGAPAFPAGVSTSVTMNQGDVLELFGYSGDLSGSVVQASQPVQVIGGHYCTQVPFGFPACDHLEESMFPYETLSTKYIVTAPAMPSMPNGKVHVVRVVGTQSGTVLTYDPPQTGLGTTLNSAGEVVEKVDVPGDFSITANHKIIVAQFMEAQQKGGDMGDPAMALAVATDQFRTSYLFHAPLSYTTNYVNVIVPTGGNVTLDGSAVSGFTPVGNSGYSVARVQLAQGVNGNHTITGDQPFGISVYGYGQYTSYWYPGGLDLANIPVP